MTTITINGMYDIEPQHIDFITPEDENGDETEDFIEAFQYRISLTDEGFDAYDFGYEVVVERSELDSLSYEMILEIIQPT
ncbi:hypothetical protein [Nostoc sp. CMAA1605]|uniref:hypothetical protein n=1 Tax=Nostoc sp. CMAA1605 TaxID=2055159 RepID=UPI001F2FE902|nr:hypothetical protein [Nostoc sp. CMAA1605]